MGEHSKDIYNLLLGAEKNKKRKTREELLRNIGVSEEYFKEGSINIDHLTCKGDECRLCIKACPSNALYWDEGKVKVEEDLCIYCGACVLSCMVDDCITVARKRISGEVEKFRTSQQLILLMNRQAVRQREETLKLILIDPKKTRLNNY